MSNDAVKMARLCDMYGDLTDYIEELEAKLAASYTRAEVEAAVKLALEGAAEQAAKTYVKSATLFELGVAAAESILALDPAQFVEGDTQ